MIVTFNTQRDMARPPPASTTPAFSPGSDQDWFALGRQPLQVHRLDLYEQCSLHITEYMASSKWLGWRPSKRSISRASSSVSPKARWPKRGRKRTAEGIEARLRQIEGRLPSSDPLTRVHLVQERINLETELASKEEAVDFKSFEDDFVGAAKAYGERKGLSYAAWRAAGVDPTILRRAGIPRTRS
jgi:hypothetical protein